MRLVSALLFAVVVSNGGEIRNSQAQNNNGLTILVAGGANTEFNAFAEPFKTKLMDWWSQLPAEQTWGRACIVSVTLDPENPQVALLYFARAHINGNVQPPRILLEMSNTPLKVRLNIPPEILVPVWVEKLKTLIRSEILSGPLQPLPLTPKPRPTSGRPIALSDRLPDFLSFSQRFFLTPEASVFSDAPAFCSANQRTVNCFKQRPPDFLHKRSKARTARNNLKLIIMQDMN